MKKRSEETQTLRAGCSKVEPKIFAPQKTFPTVRDGQNLISWRRTLPLPTNPVWWGSIHAISSYHGNRPTHTQTHTHPPTNRQDRLQYTALQLACSVINYVVCCKIIFQCHSIGDTNGIQATKKFCSINLCFGVFQAPGYNAMALER